LKQMVTQRPIDWHLDLSMLMEKQTLIQKLMD